MELHNPHHTHTNTHTHRERERRTEKRAEPSGNCQTNKRKTVSQISNYKNFVLI